MVEMRPLEITRETLEQISNYFMWGFLAMSDEDRTPEKIADMVIRLFMGNPDDRLFLGVYRQGETIPGGFLGFINIVPGLKCDVMTKIWDKRIWGPDAVRMARVKIREIMDDFNLYRMNTATADWRILKIAQMVGFKVEGERKNNYQWGGVTVKTWMMGLENTGRSED